MTDSNLEQQCPACKTNKYRNPQMKLMVNVCGHPLCESCVKLLFVKESGECPECDMILKRPKFRFQIFEDPLVEKEIDIRRRVSRIFVKQEEDFYSLDDWNFYLEDIEEIVYNLLSDDKRLEAEKKLEHHEKTHKDEIKKASYKKRSKGDEELDRLIEEEKLLQLERNKLIKREFETEKMNKIKQKASLLNDLMSSDGDASLIVKSYADRLREEKSVVKDEDFKIKVEDRSSKTLQFSSGIKFGLSNSNQIKVDFPDEKPNVYKYEPPPVPNCLPSPLCSELEILGYLNHVRKASPQSNAGGYTEHYACHRALQEFMWGHVLS